MIDKKTVAHNLLFLALGQGVSGVLMFVAMAYLARTLGPHNFGIIGFAEGVLIFFLGLTSFGLDYIGIREVAKARERVRYFTDIIISMRFLLALLSFALLVLFIFILEKPAIIKYVTLIYGISLFCAACLLDWVFQGLEKMQFVAVSSITKAVVFASGVFFLVSGQEDIIKVAIIYFLAWLMATVILMFFFSRAFGLPKFKKDFFAYNDFFKDSLPLGFLMVAGWVMHYFDLTLLFFWRGEEEAGLFNAAFRPIVLIVAGITMYFNATFPVISRSAVDNLDTLKKVMNASIGGILTILLPCIAIGVYLSDYIINKIYGEQFIYGANIFSILLLWPVLVCIIGGYGKTLVACGKQRYIGWGALVSAILNITLNLSLIPMLGGLGAAIAKVGADFVTFLFFYFIVMKNVLDIPVFKLILCPIVATFGMFVFLIRFEAQETWFVIFMGILIYLTILFLMAKLMPGWLRSMGLDKYFIR